MQHAPEGLLWQGLCPAQVDWQRLLQSWTPHLGVLPPLLPGLWTLAFGVPEQWQPCCVQDGWLLAEPALLPPLLLPLLLLECHLGLRQQLHELMSV